MTTFSARPRPRRPRRSRSARISGKQPRPLRPKPPRKSQPKSQTRVSNRSPLSFVYVGNLRSDVRVKDLKRLFMTRGTVTNIEIRCCSGSVIPSDPRGGTVYATVLFANVEDATHALSLNGDTLLGKTIVVTASFLSLPEAKRGVRRKSVHFCGVDVTKFSDTVHRVTDKFLTGGTQVFPVEDIPDEDIEEA